MDEIISQESPGLILFSYQIFVGFVTVTSGL